MSSHKLVGEPSESLLEIKAQLKTVEQQFLELKESQQPKEQNPAFDKNQGFKMLLLALRKAKKVFDAIDQSLPDQDASQIKLGKR